jgi:hypothetical protein
VADSFSGLGAYHRRAPHTHAVRDCVPDVQDDVGEATTQAPDPLPPWVWAVLFLLTALALSQ